MDLLNQMLQHCGGQGHLMIDIYVGGQPNQFPLAVSFCGRMTLSSPTSRKGEKELTDQPNRVRNVPKTVVQALERWKAHKKRRLATFEIFLIKSSFAKSGVHFLFNLSSFSAPNLLSYQK